MDFRRAFASALQIFVVFSFFGMGFFIVALPFLPEVRFQLSEKLLHQTDFFTSAGIVFFLTALFLFMGFYGLNRGRFLYIEMGQHTISVEEALIRHSLEECFKLHFPQKIRLSQVEILWGKKLEIGVALSSYDEKSQRELLMAVERQLQLLLRQRFGYIKPFSLILKST